ncbi:putative glucuronosyltransferase [Tetrabaena socialis]|uniref:Putative glucuronosyltransferase n=1 Tax=Tetrabaena socialis TaxID=47790 RepID=A0A2J8AFL1_9CHLO|nr:putative glucuronosyltransferase [Tetrabaena socialis]|eukprot:PNH11304.1 putative glucuronosyltransferase [Tetrabaena socialis]
MSYHTCDVPAGYCNDDLALCMCGYDSKFRYIPAPEGSPPWSPPVQWGRPMMGCQLGVDKDGAKLDWGRADLTYEDVYGPAGWCNNLENRRCGCAWDGNAWPCDGSIRFESVCANQCSGHGECHMGFCRCHANWYGQDCSRKRAGTDMEPGFLDEGPNNRSWLNPAVRMPPAALPTPATPTRPRPLIFVYDMPPEYNSRFLQYRFGGDNCVWRRFNEHNDSFAISSIYGIEMHMHEMMLQSDHRTFDPEEADFFYVPMYYTCYLWPIMGWADFPWWHAPTGHRPMHVHNMISEMHEWLSTKHPWWNRRGGRDHIWLTPHDEGACYMPTHVYNKSIILTHWGRMDADHTSGTAYGSDDYSIAAEPTFVAAGWKGMDWQEKRAGHPCYDPKKDLVIPDFKIPAHFRGSPLMGSPPLERDILLYFRGECPSRSAIGPHALGARQSYAHKLDWVAKHKIYIGTSDTIPGPYSEHLSRSKFCLVAPGDGFSPRLEDSILHGCVPMIVMDDVHAVFEGILDYASFSVRVRQAELQQVPEILGAISPDRLLMFQRNLARVWHRFAYGTGPVMRRTMAQVYAENAHNTPASNFSLADTPFRPLTHYPHANDAFSTILQWLHHRIDDTR